MVIKWNKNGGGGGGMVQDGLDVKGREVDFGIQSDGLDIGVVVGNIRPAGRKLGGGTTTIPPIFG